MPYGALQGDLYSMGSGNRQGYRESHDPASLIRSVVPERKEEKEKSEEGSRTEASPSILERSASTAPVQDNGVRADGARQQSVLDSVAMIDEQFRMMYGDRYGLTKNEAEVMNQLAASSEDPADALSRFLTSHAIAKQAGLPVATVFQNLDELSEYYLGNTYQTGDISLFRMIGNGFSQIAVMNRMIDWRDAVIRYGMDSPEAKAIEAEINQKQAEIGGPENFVPKSKMQQIASMVLGNAGYMFEGIEHSTYWSLPIRAATYAATLAFPLGAPAIIATGESLANVAAGVGTAKRYKDLTEAQTFWNNAHATDDQGNPIPMDLGANIWTSWINGMFVGAAETLLDGVTSRAVGSFVAPKLKRFGLSDFVVGMLVDPKAQRLSSRTAYLLTDYFMGVGDESLLEEGSEAIVDYLTGYAYKKLAGADVDFDLKGMLKSYVDSAIDGGLVALAYGALGIPGSMRGYSELSLELQREAVRSDSQEAFFSATEERKPPVVSKDDYDKARTQVYTQMQSVKSQILARGTVAESQGIAAEELYDTRNPETGEEMAAAVPDGSVYRTPDTGALYTETRDENGRRRVYAGDRNTGAVYGYAEISTDGDTLTVGSVRVRPGYEGIREELVRKAISEQRTGESSIEWNPTTEGLQKVKGLLIQNNPQGEEAGLDYGSDLSPSQDHDVESLSSTIRTAMPNLSREESVVAARLYSITDAGGTLTRLNEGQPVRNSDTLPGRYRGAADGARAIIYAGRNSDFSTFYHELFHINATQRPSEARGLSNAIRSSMQDEASKANLRKFIEESQEIWGKGFNADDVMQHLETIPADSDASQWTRGQFEDLARLAEAYATADNSKRTTLPEAIRNILRKIGEYMRKVYQTVTHTVPLPKEITEAYDAIMHKASSSSSGSSQGIQYQNRNAIRQPLKENTYESAIELANEAHPQFVGIVEDIRELTGAESEDVSVRKTLKGKKRSVEKAMEDYNGDFSQILDYDGAMFQFDSISEARNAWETVKENYSDRIVKEKHLVTKLGYQDFKVNLRMDNGSIAEIQFLDKNTLAVKSGIGHKLYEIYRTLDILNSEHPELTELQAAIAAWSREEYSAENVDDYANSEARRSAVSSVIRQALSSALSRYHILSDLLNGRSITDFLSSEGISLETGEAVAESILNGISLISTNSNATSSSIQSIDSQGNGDNLVFQSMPADDVKNQIRELSPDSDTRNKRITFSEHTPSIFQQFGFNDNPVVMSAGKLKQGLFGDSSETSGHSDSLSADIVEQVVDQLADPYYIFASTHGSDLVAIYAIRDKKGNPILVSLRANQTAGRTELNFITSIYGKEGQSIQNWIRDGLLLYRDDTKKLTGAFAARLQLPRGVAPASMNNVRRKSEFVNQGLVFQDSHVPDTSDLTEAQNAKRDEAEEADARYVDGDNTDLDSFYDGYDSSMDSIGDASDAEEMARIYSEWAVDADPEASNANASLIDEEIDPFWNDDETNLLPDGSRAESEAEYENAVNSESIPAQAEDAGLGAPSAPTSEREVEAAPDRRPGISIDDAEDYGLSWREFTDRNKPDIAYEGTDAQKDDQFVQSIQDDDSLLRYLGIIGEALYLNTRELNEDWHFSDQIQRERVKTRVFDAITNTSVRNASLTALKAELRGHDLTPRMKSLVRREMGANARFYRNILSFMIGDAAMKPEELIKDVKGLDIPSRDTLDAMPIDELRTLADTAEDKAIVDQIERGTLKVHGGEDEARASEINAALDSLKDQIKAQETALRQNEQTISQLESDLDSISSSLEKRDRSMDSLIGTLHLIEDIVQGKNRKLTGEALESYALNERMKAIAAELGWLNRSKYEEIEAQQTKGRKGRYEVPAAKKAAKEEYISSLASLYPSLFEKDGDGMGKLSGIRDIYSPSGFDKVQEVLEERREELRAEWKSEAASYATRLANSTWASSRKLAEDIDGALSRIDALQKEIERQKRLRETVKSNRDRQLYDRTTRERWVAAKRLNDTQKRFEQKIFDARTEERWKAAKKALETEKKHNLEIQNLKSFNEWRRRQEKAAASEKLDSAVYDAVTRERWLSAKKLNETVGRMQQEIDDWKSYAKWQKGESRKQIEAVARKAKDDAALLADWMKAKADVRISELKAEQREKRKQERLFKRIRAEKEKLGRAISRPVNLNTTDYETSAEAIMAIQAIVDPVFRRDWMYDLETNSLEMPGGDTMTITDAIAYLASLQEDDRNNILSVLSPDLAARLTGERNPLNDWSVSELRQLAEQVEELRRRGREVMQAKKAFERETRERIQKAIIDAVRKAGTKKGKEPDDTLPGTLERVKQAQSTLSKLRSAMYVTMRGQELAQLLDGGLGFKGDAYQLLVDEKRYHQSREWRAIDRRMNRLAPYLTKEAVKQLFEEATIQFEDGFRHSYTMNELAYIYLSQFDEDSRAAVAYGNLLRDEEKGTILNKGRLDENGRFIPEAISPGTIIDDDQLKALGDRRYAEAQRVAWEELDRRGLFPLVEEIRADFADPENFRRLNKASIETYNTPLKRVQNYLPIMRTDLRGENFRNDMADALFNLNTGDFNAALDKGMTISRIRISPRNQRGVNMQLLEVWQKSVRNQEHLIEFAQYAKKLRGVFGSNASELISTVDRVYSPGLMKEIQGYIDAVIDPFAGQPRSELDKTLRNLRGRTGAAYLGWKLPGVVLQFCTSAWPFLQDMSLSALLRGYLKLASGRGEVLNMIYEKSAMMKHRTMNTVVQEALERRGDPTRSKAGRAMDRFNEIGQLGLTWVDKTLVAGGWLGAYETALQRNLEAGMDTALADAAAVKTADDVVLRVQPAGDVTELPSLFRSRNEFAKIFLQFQSSLSVIWNNLVWDNIGFARNRQFGKLVMSVVSYGMASLALGLVADGFDDDDDGKDRLRKMSYWLLTQGVESVPIFGSDISMILQRAITGERDYYGTGTDMFPGITKLLSGLESIIASDKPFIDGAWKVAEGAGIFAGAPVSGIKNLMKASKEGPAALLGR